MCALDATVAYMREVATDDVRATLDWIADNGFDAVQAKGGRHESFGNALVEFERADGARITIVRDRSQWLCEIGTETGIKPLNVLLTAISGDAPNPKSKLHLPEQLPEGVVWREAIPAVLRWLRTGERSQAINDADQAWRKAMKKFLRG